MSTTAAGIPAGMHPGAGTRIRGAVRVREGVLEKVILAKAAVRVGVPRGDVDVEVAEWAGGVAVRIATKLPIPDLDDTEAIRSQDPILERMRQLQSDLADDLARLTGRSIRRVSFTITGAIIPERRRVR
ncbi:NTP pyrophosphohydrolase [Microbacterium suwonense]|uniref:NTP pyrophosphohydrolase n=1 Tax=Microbacterium suwonense TaxID=683047 RepID=A0ABM8FQB2_9MICO|nr:NTP pyrophosphohydrolase [Microbacterium suwonense]BDZ37857.1 hypothetical protein GCM10025863_04710 [Microbacterium suwonense]